MKLKRLFFIALLCIVGMSSAWADTDKLTAKDGWTKITSLPDNLSDYYFVFVEKDNDLMLSFEEGKNQSNTDGFKTMVYRTGEKAQMNPAMLWTLTSNTNGGYSIKSAIEPTYFIQTEWNASQYCRTHDNGGGNSEWYNWNIEYADGSWVINNGKYPESGSIGPWANGGVPTNGLDVAANCNAETGTDRVKSHFHIYSILKSKVDWEANASEENPANYTYKIINHSFERGTIYGWTNELGDNGTPLGEKETSPANNPKIGTCFVEKYWNDKPIDFNQTITNLPAGKYRVSVRARNESSSIVYVYGNTTKAEINANETKAHTVDVILPSAGSMKIGVKADSHTNGNWFAADEFELYYYGPLILNYAELSGTVKKAQAINSIYNNDGLATAITNAQAVLNNPTAESQGAIDNLVIAIKKNLPTIQQSENLDNNTGWTLSSNGSYDYKAFANYGSETNVNKAPIPATDMYGKTEGGAVGLSSGWGQAATISKTISSLPAGEYILYYEAYNGGSQAGTNITENRTSLGSAFDGKDATISYNLNAWNIIAKKIVIHENGDQVLTLGINNTGSSNNTAKLWIDNLTIYSTPNLTLPATAVIKNNTEYYMKATNNKYLNSNGDNEGVTDEAGKIITFVTTGANETLLKFDDKYIFANAEDGQSEGNWGIYTNGTIPPSNTATHSIYWVAAEKDGGYTFKDTKYNMYLAADNNGNVMKSSSEYVWKLITEVERGMVPGQDMTGKITNPGFETGNTDGWTVLESTPEQTGAKSTTDPNYEAQGSQGNYLFNIHWQGRPLTQNIGTLPAGIYQLSAMVATGDTPNNRGITFLTVNGAHSQGRISRNGNKAVMGKETMTFVSDGATTVTIGVVGGSDEASGNVYREDGYFWYKADDFHLTYLNEYSAENLYNIFKEVYDAKAPWKGSTKDPDYVSTYNTYSSYNASTPTADLLAAINYMNTKYDDYAWDNASPKHPYLMSNVIKGAELNVNTDWPGIGRSMASEAGWKGQHWSGDANRDYFEQNHDNQPARSQDVTMPFAGQYTLNTAVRVLQSGAFAEISIGDDKTRTKDVTGTTGGKINIDGSEGTSNMANGGNGFGWVYNKVVFPVENDNTTKKISIFLSDRDKSHAADAGGMFLYYIGDTYEYVKNKVHYYHGAWTNEAVVLTETAPVLDVTKATGTFNVNAANPNGLVYTKSATINGVTNNIVSNGTCANLVLVDGHNFHAHKQFEATNARYTMSSIAVKPNGNKFGTLMIPFAATNKPAGCKIYNLDQDMNLAAEILATSTDAIAANKPVLVTESGEYTASNVSIAATTAGTYSNGHLTGTYTSTTASEGTYVLQKHDYTDPEDDTWTIAFFLVGNNTETPTKPTVKPFRAYINTLNGASVKAINIIFDDEVETAIESAPASQERETVIYDLSGRRVQNVQRGIYIINGKKILK